MKTKNELIKSIDDKLHDLYGAGEPWSSMAEDAHGDLHDLAAMLSDNPSTRASVGVA
jgi:hypothetical protein